MPVEGFVALGFSTGVASFFPGALSSVFTTSGAGSSTFAFFTTKALGFEVFFTPPSAINVFKRFIWS